MSEYGISQRARYHLGLEMWEALGRDPAVYMKNVTDLQIDFIIREMLEDIRELRRAKQKLPLKVRGRNIVDG